MARAGLILNVIAIPLLAIASYFLATQVFELQLGVVPAWASAAP